MQRKSISSAVFLRTALLASVFSLGAVTAMAETLFTAPDGDYQGRVQISGAGRGEPVYSGGEASVSGRGFKPGQKVTLLYGSTVLDTDVTVDGEGNFSASVKLPEEAAVGSYPIIVTTDAPYYADIADLKVSPKVPFSGEDAFSITKGTLPSGAYQSAYSAKENALFVTAASGRPPVEDSSLVKLDPETLEVLKTATPPEAPGKDGKKGGVFAVYGVAVDDAAGTVWATNTRQNTVAVYNQSDLSLVKQFDEGTAEHPRDVAVDEKNGKAYVSSLSSNEIVVYDTKSLEVLKAIPLASKMRGEDFSPVSLSIDQATGKLFTVSMSTNEVAVVDTATDEVLKVMPVPGSKTAMGVAYDNETDTIFVASQGSDNLVMLNGETGKAEHTVLVGANPLNVAFDPVNKLAYVASRGAGSVTAVDMNGEIVGNFDEAAFANHVFADGKGDVFAVNKSRSRGGEDSIERITPAN